MGMPALFILAEEMIIERKGVMNMLKTTCLICKKEFAIPYSDFRYKDIKYNRNKNHICNQCSFTIREEAIKISGINPDELDYFDRILRQRSS